MEYKLNKSADTTITTGKGLKVTIPISMFENALHETNSVIGVISRQMPVDIFSILGMRNLSAFVGEVFAKSLAKVSDEQFIGNPHQDGYPDLLLMDQNGKRLFEEIRSRAGLRDKAPFSPFKNGGIEIKATCGSVPSPSDCQKIGAEKPDMGDTRIDHLKSYDWKAHHRETNNLAGILWDFIDGIPCVVAVFFGNNLLENDWGNIVQPKEGGGRTTSVSIMKRHGIKKMYMNWVAVIQDPRYINFINSYNKDRLIKL